MDLENKPSEGLGDTLAKIFHAVGIDKVAKKAAEMMGKEDCGCEERKEMLNEIVPYKKKVQKQVVGISLANNRDLPSSLPNQDDGKHMYLALDDLMLSINNNTFTYKKGNTYSVGPHHFLYRHIDKLISNNKIKHV